MEAMLKTNNMVTVSLNGQMEESIKEAGKMENKMEKEYMLMPLVSSNRENGQMERESDGLMVILEEEMTDKEPSF